MHAYLRCCAQLLESAGGEIGRLRNVSESSLFAASQEWPDSSLVLVLALCYDSNEQL